MPSWTYHVVLADGTDTVMEVGPFPALGRALIFAAASMGRTDSDVSGSVVAEAVAASPAPGPVVDWHVKDDGSYRRLIGYTIERYDGEETDGSWSLNGGIRSEILEAVAA